MWKWTGSFCYTSKCAIEDVSLGHCTPNLKLARFVLYLKIIDTFSKNSTCISKEIIQGTRKKNGIEILVGQAIFKLWIKTVKLMLWSITHGLLRYAICEFLGQFTIRCICYFSKSVDNFEIKQRTWWYWLGVQYPLKGASDQEKILLFQHGKFKGKWAMVFYWLMMQECGSMIISI